MNNPADQTTNPIPVVSAKSNLNKFIVIGLSVVIVGLIGIVTILAFSVTDLTGKVNKLNITPTLSITTTQEPSQTPSLIPTMKVTPTLSSTPIPTVTLTPTTKPTAIPTLKLTSTPVPPTPTTEPGDVKPVIYLYPSKTELVNVQVQYKGIFTVTYPQYINGWNVIANPNGQLLNLADYREYSYLFWEGIDKDATYDLTTGFIVKGEDSAAFLQTKLAQLGLTPKEYNEFIVYWLPKMLHNKYNLVHFASTTEYNDRAVLNISPKPDSVLRIFMILKPIENNINITPQNIHPFERKGFTVIEWGGSELN